MDNFDPGLVKMYNDIKDPSWPEIADCIDLFNLPKNTVKELIEEHSIEQHLTSIYKPTTWAGYYPTVFLHENVGFVSIPKCGSMYYGANFLELGWQRKSLKEIDLDSVHLVGAIMHPIKRHLKGLTQFIANCYGYIIPGANSWNDISVIDWAELNTNLESKNFVNLISGISIGDHHSAPYSAMFGDSLNKINWFPIELFSKEQLNSKILDFFASKGINIEFPISIQEIHKSSKDQIRLYNIIKEQFNNTTLPNCYYQFGPDLKFYFDLIKKFQYID